MTLFQQQIAEIKSAIRQKPSNQLKVTSSRDVYDYVAPLWPDMDYRESFQIDYNWGNIYV